MRSVGGGASRTPCAPIHIAERASAASTPSARSVLVGAGLPAQSQRKAFTGLRPFAVIARSAATWQSSAFRFGWHSPLEKNKAFTGLRPARPFSRRKRTQNALRRARADSAPASSVRCASWQPQAGAELTRPCVQTAAPIPCVCLRCSPRLTASCRTRPAHPCATRLLFRFIPPHHARVLGCTAGAVNPRVSALRPQPGLRQPVIL